MQQWGLTTLSKLPLASLTMLRILSAHARAAFLAPSTSISPSPGLWLTYRQDKNTVIPARFVPVRLYYALRLSTPPERLEQREHMLLDRREACRHLAQEERAVFLGGELAADVNQIRYHGKRRIVSCKQLPHYFSLVSVLRARSQGSLPGLHSPLAAFGQGGSLSARAASLSSGGPFACFFGRVISSES